jgi:heat-inducible transcriptional repressor
MSDPAVPGRIRREDPELTDRQRAVFAALVRLHERCARPVGSESLSAHGRVGLSPASLRTALGELEEMGLLLRVHASGGRQPTATGWELYVRTLVVPTVLEPEVLDTLATALQRSAHDVEHLLHEASRLLSSVTRQLGLAQATSLEGGTLAGLDLTPLGERRVLMILDLGPGRARTLVLELGSALEHDELAEVGAVLRERLAGRSLSEVRERLERDPELIRHSAVRMVARAVRESWAQPVSTPLFTAGTMHIAEQPEFQSAPRLGSVLRAVESGSPLERLLFDGLEGQTVVRVGLDEDRALSGCSLVTFRLSGPRPAALGVLGPLRMDYARTFAAVDAVGLQVKELMQS